MSVCNSQMGHTSIMLQRNRQMVPLALCLSVRDKCDILELCLTVSGKWALWHFDCLVEHYSNISDSDSKIEQSVLYPTVRVKWDISTVSACDSQMELSAARLHKPDPL
jgi:hypothetical protein